MKMRTQLLLGFGVVFTVILLVVGISYQTTRSLLYMNTSVEHAHEIMAKARKVQKLVVDMQARKRGFLITGKDAYLTHYEETVQEYKEEIGELRGLVTNDPRQTERVEEVEKLIHRWTQTVALRQIEERRKVNTGEATLSEFIGKVQEEEGGEYQLFENVRSELNAFIDAHRAQLSRQQEEAETAADRSIFAVLLVAIAGSILGIGAILYVVRSTLRQVGGEPSAIAGVTEQIANGNLDIRIEGGTGIRASVARMLEALRTNRDHTQRQDWLKTGIARLNGAMSGDPEIDVLASRVISEMATYLDAQVGALYLAQDGEILKLSLIGTYAYTKRKNLSNAFGPGEGLVGQAALEKQQILVKNVPEDYVKVTSGLGERIPTFICVTPFLYEERVKGVVEIGTLSDMSDQQMDYLTQAMPALAIAVEGAHSRTQLARSLEESQRLTEELQAQQEELKAANEELEEQTQRLQESEERLKAQQEELEVTNEELEEKNDLLERQKREVEQARSQIEEKAAEVALASKYKSEFLANMSHELRTPLNSLLLLAQGLAENREGNLTADQVESAKIVYNSGSDLLQLINEILDLSKIESGRVELQSGQVPVRELAEGVRASFDHLCKEKGIGLEVTITDDSPIEISSDRKRVQQMIRNLVSNAVKFTESGGVTVTFGQLSFVNGHWQDDTGKAVEPRFTNAQWPMTHDRCLSITVQDTGIGIAPEHQKIIFEAFQQADGGTSRKYGGTGLGLSISRELAHLLGGEIQLESEVGKGSTFTLYLPIEPGTRNTERGSQKERTVPSSPFRVPRSEDVQSSIADDRENIQAGDRAILVIEDDPKFARILFNKCHKRGFKCLAAPTGEMGLELAAKHLPTAVILDIRLPGIDGWSVLQALKEDTHTRHIPVHVISIEQSSTESLRKGAVGHAVKPVSQEDLEATFQKLDQVSTGQPKRVLVVEDDPKMRGVVAIGNPVRECGDCPLSRSHNGGAGLGVALVHGGREFGYIGISLLPEYANDEEEKSLLAEVAGDIVSALHGMDVEAERKRSEQTLHAIFDSASDGILLADAESGRFVVANNAICRMLGYTAEEIKTLSVEDIHPVESVDYVRSQFEKQARGEITLAEDIPVLRRDGGVFHADVSAAPLEMDGRSYLLGIFRDITERKEAEKALKEAHDIVNRSSSVAFTWRNAEGWPVEFVSENIQRLLGYSAGEFIRGEVNYTGCIHPEDLARVAEEVVKHSSEAETLEFVHEPYRIIAKDGSEKTVRDWTFIVRDNDARITHYKGIVEDITELKQAEEARKAMEEQFRQSQKLEAVGRLSGGIAHDFNNLLTTILGNADMVLMDTNKEDPRREMIEEIKGAGKRAANLTRQLLAFSRKQILQPEVIDLNAVVKDMGKMLSRIISEDIELTTDLAPDLGEVEADVGQIEQVIMNLCVNAKDAMLGGGKLTIETGNVELDEAYALTHMAVTPGAYVMLAVSDTGIGMAQDLKSQIFEPFFTTKEKGKGTGLGLSTVYGIVNQSNGNIWVYSEPGKGSTFKIYLPAHEETSQARKETARDEEILHGSETILLVEDDEMVGKTALKALEGYGYVVLYAPEGQEALRILREYGDPIHLMLTDVVMPGMSGGDLAARARGEHPDLKVLYMSGYTDNDIVHKGFLDKGIAFLQKPFTPDRLARKVREVLES